MAHGRNLLFILSDEHQARAMGCAGHSVVQTPHLDALAARGTRFTNAYTPSPICVPARASLATGRPVHETGAWDNAMPYTGSMPSWGHALQARGVRCESIGKLHYRNTDDATGFDRMHHPMMVAGGVGMVWASLRDEATRKIASEPMLGAQLGPGNSSYTDYDAEVTRRACDWLDAAGPEPWCLYVGLVAPHFPLVVPQPFYDLYPHDTLPPPKAHPADGYVRHPWVAKQNAFMDSEAHFESEANRQIALASYYGLCSWLDHNVGQILTALDRAGLTENTTVIYSSDHGDNAGARGLWGKSNFYEESVAIPLIMAGPNVARGTCDTAVDLLDVTATLTDHFGAEPVGHGKPLRNIIVDPEPDRPVLSQYHAAGAVSGAFMLRQGRFKLICYMGFEDELFDLVADPEELTNLATDPAYDAVRARLHAQLEAMCDTEAANAQAFAHQAALIAHHGGREAALALGAPGATPPPPSPERGP
ncbi:sulfatase-like hydrolase/transferase [uncultured Tateyamaria sp.]|uniref:sulfatase-like hydrolase/transferase n=1 Tax=uncultured Tateyamaria sp. TaxID=455651 RepID=UPI00260AB8D5|nr:sulfatase-like hydrolase/transferase [uncultured Tateyamaria sp.]